ncbi:hypothetical protein AVEN_142426-1 [Araneus ventricosus]|uniref:Uncharacterized protein n=1 Tax=Araneus ventricosus TaxID=182803 RepID=A0A4Y2IGN4_ARAVE|nr:hypothetical protein AVEN_142426-1 [Araneus ventricosus]
MTFTPNFWELLEHPPYMYDLGQSDFHLFKRSIREVSASEPMWKFSKPFWHSSMTLTLLSLAPVSISWCTVVANGSTTMVTSGEVIFIGALLHCAPL